MTVLNVVLLCLAMTLNVVMGVYAVRRSRSDGAVQFFSLMMFSFVWSGATLMESLMTHAQSMILWRNVQQLGVFGTPLIILFFAITHTRRTKLLPYAYSAMVIQTLVFFLVVTDNIHHLVRDSVSVVLSPLYGRTLVVVLSPLGDLFVLLTILLALAAVVVLSFRTPDATDNDWRQIRTIRLGVIMIIIAGILKWMLLPGVNAHIPVTVLALPGLMVMFNASVRQDMLS